jgi:hypothetical protein
MSDTVAVYRAVLAIAGIGLLVSAAEYWVRADAFGPTGPFAWRVLSLRRDVPKALGSLVGRLPARATVRVLMAVRVTALLAAVASQPGEAVFTATTGLLVASEALLYWRRTSVGADGADQMTALIFVTTFLCAGIAPTEFTLNAGLWFIAAQGCFSYLAAGIAKLVSPTWRSGAAVGLILNTGAYGTPGVARLLGVRTWLSAAMSWSAMALETVFPIALVAPEPVRWTILAAGALFHVQCAVLMGLNTFLWAFIATYPAIVFVAAHLREVL